MQKKRMQSKGIQVKPPLNVRITLNISKISKMSAKCQQFQQNQEKYSAQR